MTFPWLCAYTNPYTQLQYIYFNTNPTCFSLDYISIKMFKPIPHNKIKKGT